VILEAGGFDEALTSTTDRDLCIRIADLGYVKYGIVKEHLVHHNAFSQSDRMSSVGSKIKHSGLTYFHKKYKGRMKEDVQEKFFRRSWDLFHWKPSEDIRDFDESEIPTIPQHEIEHMKIIVGSITSPQITHIIHLLENLNALRKNSDNIDFHLIILENSGYNLEIRRCLKEQISHFIDCGMNIDFITLERQKSDLLEFELEFPLDVGKERMDIASSRTLLQLYLQIEARMHPNALVWILDDDSRFDNVISKGTSIDHQTINLNNYCRYLKENKNSIVLAVSPKAYIYPMHNNSVAQHLYLA
jgi:hypothetical protein